MNKDEHFLVNRFLELANISYQRDIYTNTDFLNLNEINLLYNIKNQLPPVKFTLSGGNDYTERKIAVFSPKQTYYEFIFPITVIKVTPTNSQFAEQLNHRDFLGAILNLGINRSKIGDIIVIENHAYVYCMEEIADYIIDNLYKIRHTMVKVAIYDKELSEISPKIKNIKGTVANVRLDSLIACAFSTSRNSIISYIENGKVFVNGKLITSNGYSPKENDIISVRGKGRFMYEKSLGTTKKGRNLISINLYI